MALSGLSIAALAVLSSKASPSSFLAASVPKTVGMCSPQGLRLFRHHLRAASAVQDPLGSEWDVAACHCREEWDEQR